ncbi:MAG: ribosome maturation factor RimM [Alphaproteobacteria bacterium]
MSVRDKRVCLGIVTAAHGVRGAVRVKSFTTEPEDVAGYGPLEDERGERRFALRIVGSAKGVLIAAISGIDDRDRAEALRGLRLYLPRAALPPPAEEEYYHADLIGLEAALPDGAALGTVRAVHDFGAGDTLEIERASGKPVMVPFTRAVVPVVDLAAGRLVIDPPPGLLDEAAPERRSPPSNPPLPGLDPGITGKGMGGGKRARNTEEASSATPTDAEFGA